MGQAVAGKLNADRSDESGPRLPCGCGGEARFAGRRPKTFTTALGALTLERAWYHCERCHQGFSPRDRRLGMEDTGLSPAVLRMLGIAAVASTNGLLCTAEGCPIAVQVYEGNTADPATLSDQVDKLRRRFGLQRVVLVGDRGMLTSARIDQELREVDGLDWVSALRSDAIGKLASEKGPLQMSLFDRTDFAEVTHPQFPGERLIACLNPLLREERARKREALLQATAHLATLTRNTVRLQRTGSHLCPKHSLPTTVQHRAFELLGVPIPT